MSSHHFNPGYHHAYHHGGDHMSWMYAAKTGYVGGVAPPPPPPPAPGHMETMAYQPHHPHSSVFLTPKSVAGDIDGGMANPHVYPWACDFCRVARFATYEEACAHEQVCSHNKQNRGAAPPSNYQAPRKPVPNNSGGDPHRRRLLLSMPNDKDSLSDRQCFVRRHFVEVFAATESDVASRHSKGAQKLHHGQVGIRCVFCTNTPARDRAERAMCYPRSICRIYQTVADMQRFHFESCQCIPEDMKKLYSGLKTTRPRGVGSPQSYWISSAKELGLVDSEEGIRYGPKLESMLQKEEERKQVQTHHHHNHMQHGMCYPVGPPQTPTMSPSTVDTSRSPSPSSPPVSGAGAVTHHHIPHGNNVCYTTPPPSPPRLQSQREVNAQRPPERSSAPPAPPQNSDARMLLALRNQGGVPVSKPW